LLSFEEHWGPWSPFTCSIFLEWLKPPARHFRHWNGGCLSGTCSWNAFGVSSISGCWFRALPTFPSLPCQSQLTRSFGDGWLSYLQTLNDFYTVILG
jgi:hypothetical protein